MVGYKITLTLKIKHTTSGLIECKTTIITKIHLMVSRNERSKFKNIFIA